MALNFQFIQSSAEASQDGLFIPITNLVGVTDLEFGDSESIEVKESKLIYSLCNIFSNGLTESTLGITATAGSITGQSDNLSSKNFGFTLWYAVDHELKTVDMMPLPIIGNQVETAKLSISDCFPDAILVLADTLIEEEGVLIPSALIQTMGGIAHESINISQDSRSWLSAFIRYFISYANVRSVSVASAITSKTIRGTEGLILPVGSLDTINPSTGLDSNKLSQMDFFQRILSISIQRIENEITQTYDVNVTTI